MAVRDLLAWTSSVLPRSGDPKLPTPWLTFACLRWLESHVRSDMDVFEWGSGGSTLYFAPRVRSLVSVEHDQDWHATVDAWLRRRGISHVRLVLQPPEDAGATPREQATRLFQSSDAAYRDKLFVGYVKAIDAYPQRSFDLILIDGRSRVGCLAHALDKVKAGGAIVFDNSDDPRCAAAISALDVEAWTIAHFEGPGPRSLWPAFWRTSVLRRRGGG